MAHAISIELEQEGFVRLPQLLTQAQLQGMQQAFDARLQRMSWNDTYGYERTETYRRMIQDILALDQGFLDVALHPLVKQVLHDYLGPGFQLVEAKGWQSVPTTKDFHGWHGDAWYDQQTVSVIPREIKLGLYLTDVKTGAFHYIKRSHRTHHPRLFQNGEVVDTPTEDIVEVTGPAGSAFLFDTSGIHRQGMPILEPRQAIFLNYHDPAIPLQREDVQYYRYHPLLLNAAYLGQLREEDQRILGFGDKRNYQHGFVRRCKHPGLEAINRLLVEATLQFNQAMYYPRRALAKIRTALGRG